MNAEHYRLPSALPGSVRSEYRATELDRSDTRRGVSVPPVPTSFDVDRFIADCRAGLADRSPRTAIRELVARVVSEPAELLRALGEPARGGIQPLNRSNELT